MALMKRFCLMYVSLESVSYVTHARALNECDDGLVYVGNMNVSLGRVTLRLCAV